DLCPVGSLLSKDFLHRARAWELDKTASVCTGCSQGCNVTLDTRDNIVVRVRPRPNLEVNRYFLCDHGRMHYRWMNRGDRIEAPLVKRGGGELQAVDWDEALERAATVLPGGARNAEVVLPIANVAEEDGSFVNRDGRVQRYFQAKPAPGMARPAWWVLAELLGALENSAPLTGPAAVFDRLAQSAGGGPFAGLGYASLGLLGKQLTTAVGAPA